MEASCSCLHRDRVTVTCLCITPSSHPTLPKHTLTLYCLWSCFIMSSYMHIIDACPTQAAWLRWNIWIIYHLQSALPHFRKFFPTNSQNYSCFLHLQEGRGKQGQNWAEPNLYALGFVICFTLHFSLFIVFLSAACTFLSLFSSFYLKELHIYLSVLSHLSHWKWCPTRGVSSRYRQCTGAFVSGGLWGGVSIARGIPTLCLPNDWDKILITRTKTYSRQTYLCSCFVSFIDKLINSSL